MVYLAVSLVFALLVATFAMQNAIAVRIRFLSLSFHLPLALVILGSATCGALLMALLSLFREFRLRGWRRAARVPDPATMPMIAPSRARPRWWGAIPVQKNP